MKKLIANPVVTKRIEKLNRKSPYIEAKNEIGMFDGEVDGGESKIVGERRR